MTTSPTPNLDAALANCMKCGFCKAACPVFTDEETTSPRAKVRLAKAVLSGEIELSRAVRGQMERCLNCRACASECPSGIKPNEIALAMRCFSVERMGLTLGKRLAFHLALPHPGLLAAGCGLAGLGQRISGIGRPGSVGRRLLPILGIRRDKDIPRLPRQTLFSVLPEVVELPTQPRITVAYFPGCATNLIYPEIGLAAVSTLTKLGARVIIPRGLVCCSTPVFNSGDVPGARRLARRSIDLLSQVNADFIITACGSCGLTIRHEWQNTLGLPEAGPVAAKVMDIHEFVARYASSSQFNELHDTGTLTYHDSCHLRRGLGIRHEPRQLLRAALGARFTEMDQSDRCCGGGGTFTIHHPELSQQVAETKMQCLAVSGAQSVAAGCPACVMQLRDSLVHRGMPQSVLHSIQIIDRAMTTKEGQPPAPVV